MRKAEAGFGSSETPDVETSSHEVGGQGSRLRRERRPAAAENGPGPEGSRLTVDIRRPWGCGAEEGVLNER